ncbi:GNAT family N-acetyltransferase [Streptomyces sp. NPDC057307]|uniref:GNAT family N-acetyltransferase n=1 Tax=Streptomyces sp. NPDC057307 TaxID=3346096 RepID=UPI00362EF0A1
MSDLITDRLVLRSWPPAEVSAVVGGSRLPHWAEDFPAEGDSVIAGFIAGRSDALGPYGQRQIVERATGLVVGAVGLFPPTEGTIEFGYGIVPSRRGRGYASEAARAIAAFALTAPGIHTVRANVELSNPASARVLEKAGLSRVGDDGGTARFQRRRGDMADDNGQTPMTDEEIEAASLGAAQQVNGQVTLGEYDPRWPAVYEREARLIDAQFDTDFCARIGTAGAAGLGASTRPRLEHVGSTSVPGLPAKPVVDMLLIVADPGDEASYVPALESVGYTVAVREPDWYEHRVLRKQDLDPSASSANLHVLPAGCPEVDRMLRFRDRLRTHPGDRELYAETKRGLARQEWKYLQNYADAKTEVVERILERARPAR